MNDWRHIARSVLSIVGMLGFVRQCLGRRIDGTITGRSGEVASQEAAVHNTALPTIGNALKIKQVGSLAEYEVNARESQAIYRDRWRLELHLAQGGVDFITPGFCYVCDSDVVFHTDFLYSDAKIDGKPVPNWRERVLCSKCQMSNRVRACIHLLETTLGARKKASVYLAEQVTPLYRELKIRFPALIGSEYLGDKIAYGTCNEAGIRNESITKLTFSNNSFDYILNFDVLEHVPDVTSALQEIHRTLAANGTFLFSVPFMVGEKHTRKRALINSNGTIEYLFKPEYHGDPIADTGCLCFQDFGWDLLDLMRKIGFTDVNILLYWSDRFGYYGVEQMMIVGKKRS